MSDLKPPRGAGDEREVLLLLLQFQRDSVVRKVDGLDDEAARRSPVGSGTTLLWLVKHLAWAESLWVLQRFAGEPGSVGDDSVGPEDSVGSAIEAYRETWAQVDATVAASSLDDLCRNETNLPSVDLRWVLMHLLEETARHAGHADVLRELIDGQTGR